MEGGMGKSAGGAIATVAMVVLLITDGAYAFMRAYAAIDLPSTPLVDPSAAGAGAWSIHIALFWRIAVGGYAAGMVAPLAYLAAIRDPARTVEALDTLALVVAVVAVVQGLALP
jgi:hypothetical protein